MCSSRAESLRRRVQRTLGVTIVLAFVTLANAQMGPANSQNATRAELATQLASLESQLQTASLKKDKVEELQQQVADVKERLENGDFKIGDRFVYTLTMDSVRSDTASVRDGFSVSIMSLPDVSLKGVLRSELDDVLNAHISKYLKNARIRTVILTQVSVLGAVSRPGYYWASGDRPISELIMMAGGPVPEANLRELEVKRANKVVLKAKDSRKAIEESRTIEQVGIRSGDEVRIPMKRKVNWGQVIQLMFVASSLFFASIQFIQWYYNRKE